MKCDEKESAKMVAFKPESPFVIVCEGFQDSGLICALLKHLNVQNCDVTFPKKKRDGANGKEGIPNMVALLEPVVSVKGVAIIRDADDDPVKSFQEAQAGFVGGLVAPAKPFTVIRAKQRTTGVFLIPGNGKTGAIEHLLLDAVFARHPAVATCIDGLVTCSQKATNWSENRKAKMKMQSVIASFCEDDPGCSLGFIWQKGKDNPIDIQSPVFQELADFLIDFTSDPIDPNKHADKPM